MSMLAEDAFMQAPRLQVPRDPRWASHFIRRFQEGAATDSGGGQRVWAFFELTDDDRRSFPELNLAVGVGFTSDSYGFVRTLVFRTVDGMWSLRDRLAEHRP
jgi:hypothetical protein